ncbi:hypothetical protein UlMin_008535 [Ulmus minor]
MEIRVPSPHERVDWVVPGWVAMYELMLKDGMRFPIPRLIRDVCDHYKIAPSQLMPNAWRVLMSLESLGRRHGVDCELGEVLFSYYLKELDIDKGRYILIARVGRAPIVTCLRTNDRGWKGRYLFVRGDLVWGPSGPGGVPGHWKSISCEFNRVLPSGLFAEERTRQLLEIVVAERDYRVALSEENLKASGLWAFVEERQGTPALPLDFVLPILRLRHAIHVTFGGCDLFPLTTDELSLVKGMMSGNFNIPSAKEAKQLLKGAASSSQKEKKRKRGPLPNTRVVNNPEAYKQSKAATSATQIGMPPVSGSVEPSLAKSAKKAKTKSSKDEGKLLVAFPAEGFAYSDPSFVNEVTDCMLLPRDRRRLNEIGPVKTT